MYMSQSIARHTQDMKMAIKNGEKVTMWSLVHVSALVAIMVIQTFMVKHLFADKSLYHRLSSKFKS